MAANTTVPGHAGTLHHPSGAAPASRLARILDRWEGVASRFELSDAARSVGRLLFTIELDPSSIRGPNAETPEIGASRRQDLLVAAAVASDDEWALDGLVELEARGLVVANRYSSGPWLAGEVEIEPRVRQWCVGTSRAPAEPAHGYVALPRLERSLAETVEKCARAPERFVVAIRGRRGSGRDAAAAELLRRLARAGLRKTVLELRQGLDPLEPELSGAAPIWDARRADPGPDDYDLAARWLRRGTTIAIALLDLHEDVPEVDARSTLCLTLDARNLRERTLTWRGALGPLGLPLETEQSAAQTLAARAFVGAGHASRAVALLPEGGVESAADLVERLETRLQDLVQPSTLRGVIAERPDSPLERVVVADSTSAMLRHLLHLCRTHGALDASGRAGVTALFAGPSGTGKTMAARAIAHSLGRPLYRVDLASVVSKWVGETEKNLRDALAAAEVSGAVLLFDEGDALFGKRGEVSKGTDRYANLEVSYLLQALEAYAGIAIATTNLRANVDSAFERRFDITIEFRPPAARERALIWRQELGDAAHDLGPAVLDQVARRAELNGGSIACAARFARVLAFTRGSEAVSEADLATAIHAEFLKMGSTVQAAQWLATKP